MTPKDLAVLLLASGTSARFGKGDKLTAPLHGKPLVMHAADTILSCQFGFSFAVVAAGNHTCMEMLKTAGITVRQNMHPEDGQGASLALGVREVSKTSAAGVLVMLADMPFVRPQHLTLLCEKIGDADAAVSIAGDDIHSRKRMPPVLFARSAFEQLSVLEGDKGAKILVEVLPSVVETPLSDEEAIDIDTPYDLKAAMQEEIIV